MSRQPAYAPAHAPGLLASLPRDTAPPDASAATIIGGEGRYYFADVIDDGFDLKRMSRHDLLSRLRLGLTVNISCSTTAPLSPDTASHRLRLNPDGTVTMLDHPHATVPPGGLSTHLDHEVETFLHALGEAPACLALAVALTKPPNRRVGQQARTRPNDYVLLKLRSVHAAIAWAQGNWAMGEWADSPDKAHPPAGPVPLVWPLDGWRRFIRAGITPAVLTFWVQNGWNLNRAIEFLNHQAPFDVADTWRAVGDTSTRAARLAGKGDVPADDHAWANVGFETSVADRWRTSRAWPNISPPEAWDWHQDGVSPQVARQFTDLPTTPTQALRASSQKANFARRQGWVRDCEPTLATALAWTRAGVPCQQVVAWHRILGGSAESLETALAWADHVPARTFGDISAWNRTHPQTPLTPSVASTLIRLGVPADAETMGAFVLARTDTAKVLAVLDMTIHGKRWWGIEARAVLGRAAHETYQAVHGHTYAERPPSGSGEDPVGLRHKTAVESLVVAIEENRWDWVVAGMRLPYADLGLWKPLFEWLSTDPRPTTCS